MKIKIPMCEQCGALVGDEKLHTSTHTSVIKNVGYRDVEIIVRVSKKRKKVNPV